MEKDTLEVVDQSTQGEGEPSPDKGAGDKKQISVEEYKQLQRRYEETERERNELRESERYWAEKARGASGGKEDDAGEDIETKEDFADLIGEITEDDGDNDKFIDELTSEGHKALKKRGFLTRKEAIELANQVAERVASKVAQAAVGKAKKGLEKDAAMVRDFPFLNDQESEGFKLTAEFFNKKVKRNPAAAKDPEALYDAAEAADAVLKARPAAKSDKRRRVDAQADVGSRFSDDDGGEELTDMQKSLVEKFGISEEAYKKRAKKGVQIKGLPQFQQERF